MHLFSRLVNEFNEILEYTLFGLISWNMYIVSILMLTLQFQLVKYIEFIINFSEGSTRFDQVKNVSKVKFEIFFTRNIF